MPTLSVKQLNDVISAINKGQLQLDKGVLTKKVYFKFSRDNHPDKTGGVPTDLYTSIGSVWSILGEQTDNKIPLELLLELQGKILSLGKSEFTDAEINTLLTGSAPKVEDYSDPDDLARKEAALAAAEATTLAGVASGAKSMEELMAYIEAIREQAKKSRAALSKSKHKQVKQNAQLVEQVLKQAQQIEVNARKAKPHSKSEAHETALEYATEQQHSHFSALPEYFRVVTEAIEGRGSVALPQEVNEQAMVTANQYREQYFKQAEQTAQMQANDYLVITGDEDGATQRYQILLAQAQTETDQFALNIYRESVLTLMRDRYIADAITLFVQNYIAVFSELTGEAPSERNIRIARTAAERPVKQEIERPYRSAAQAEEILRKSERQARQKSERQALQKSERQARQKSERQALQKSERQALQKSERQARQKSERQARSNIKMQLKDGNRVLQCNCAVVN